MWDRVCVGRGGYSNNEHYFRLVDYEFKKEPIFYKGCHFASLYKYIKIRTFCARAHGFPRIFGRRTINQFRLA